MLHIRLRINPVPASRPRVSKFGTYYPKRHKAFQSAALALLSELREKGNLPGVPMTGRLRLRVIFNVTRPKTTKLLSPRGDIDNYCKILMDCCNGIVWEDDHQVVSVCAVKEFTSREGWIELWITEVSDESVTAISGQPKGPQPERDDSESSPEQGLDICFGSVVSLSNQ